MGGCTVELGRIVIDDELVVGDQLRRVLLKGLLNCILELLEHSLPRFIVLVRAAVNGKPPWEIRLLEPGVEAGPVMPSQGISPVGLRGIASGKCKSILCPDR